MDSEDDRRTLTALLAAAGLAVRIVKVKRSASKSSPYDRYVEYAETAVE